MCTQRSLMFLVVNMAPQKQATVMTMPSETVYKAVSVGTCATAALGLYNVFHGIISSYRFSIAFSKVTIHLKYVTKYDSIFLYT